MSSLATPTSPGHVFGTRRRPSLTAATSTRPTPGRVRARRQLGFIVACALVASITIATVIGTPMDLAVYLRAANDVLAGRDPYLTPEGTLPFLYPPPAALAFVPLALLPTPLATIALTATSAVALARIVALAARAQGRTPAWWWAPAAVVSEPVMATLIYGQVNILVVWLCLEGYLSPNQRRGGVLIGLGVVLKLTPALFVLPLILRRRWDAVGACAVAFGTCCVVGALAAPAASAYYWTTIVGLSGRVGLDFPTNQSYTGALAQLAGMPTASIAGAALGVATIGLLLWALLRHPGDPLRDAVTTGLAGLLASPISWTHHWIWAIPLMIWCQARWRVLRLAWVVSMAAWPDVRGGTLASFAPPVALVLSNTYLLLGLTTLIALARCRPAPGRGGSGREACCAGVGPQVRWN